MKSQTMEKINTENKIKIKGITIPVLKINIKVFMGLPPCKKIHFIVMRIHIAD